MIRRAFRHWRPIALPPWRECVSGVAIYATLGGLGWALVADDPKPKAIAVGIAAGCLLLLSVLLDKKVKP